MNKTWHDQHVLGRGASMDERVQWHLAHAKACGCRPIPKTVQAAIDARSESRLVRVTAVQAAPVFLDLDATVDKTCALIDEAAAGGAQLVVFPETFLPTYPDWVWRTNAWDKVAQELYTRLFANAVDVPGPVTVRLGEAAARAGVYVCIGVNERAGGTLYNTQLYVAPDGTLMGKHRKLMPTGGERLVWGMGDGSTLSVFDTEFGRVGGLTCWENYMPLARSAIYAQGVELYLAPTWDNSEVWVPTLRHIAKEGRTFVVGVNFCMRASDVPADLPGRDELYGLDDEWLAEGNTTIVDPWGQIVAGPLVGEEGLVTADLDLSICASARSHFDPVGHYSRPDVFTLMVNDAATSPVRFGAGG
jgi:nitrilase